jgi:hypothetical protein
VTGVQTCALPISEATPAPAADDEIDLSRADVFSIEATDRLAAVVRERREVVEDDDDLFVPEAPVTATVAVGNTLRTVEIAAESVTEAEPAPTLAVVEIEDQIAGLTPKARLVTFG